MYFSHMYGLFSIALNTVALRMIKNDEKKPVEWKVSFLFREEET